ncbi:tyrosine kinase receptor Cad96Ca-like [Lineus longissimus]|uniref:tyrosine kinase receptor Cad96Ca-like n=1 Tax=Lineus longissimus TaxID=88925 RepID=UPI00315DB168
MATLRFCDVQNDSVTLLPFAKDLATNGCSEMTVAVKKLHEYADKCQKQEFLREIHLMKTLGSHQNVVNMIGCCTIEEPLCLVVEHMPNGDLLHYLRKHRNSMQGEGVQDGDIYYEEDRLKYQDLLSFARQIAKGMEFLSQKGFVHRDLASRNILVGENRMVKVSDFGLTRYVYDDKVYVNRKGGKLPLKWMSIEAIFDLTFSTASDVWAFGVVLFEIITLGGTPYPIISNKDLLRELKMGYRMEKPDNCDDELYHMMLDCWSQCPNDRPDFTDLKLHLDMMIEKLCKTDYLDIDLENMKAYYNAPIMEEDDDAGNEDVGDDFEDIFGAGVDLEVLENRWQGSTVRLASGEEDLTPSCSSNENLIIRRTSPSTSGNSSGRESMEAKDDHFESPSDLSDLNDEKDNPCPLVLCTNHDSGHVSYDIELDSGPESDLYLSQRRSMGDSKDDIPLWDVCV